MKSSPTLLQDATDDDIFGPPRAYTTTYYTTTRQRPTMISAKYRQKEERRKVLKISVNKLRKIEDPENSLCRSVLINNTMKRLQRESKEEKLSQCHHLKKSVVEFAKLEPDDDDHLTDNNINNINSSSSGKKLDVVEEECAPPTTPTTDYPPIVRKRTIDEVDECDVQDVLSQFYMPPTPRMLTSIDDDEDLLHAVHHSNSNNGNSSAEAKRPKYEEEKIQVPVTTASSFSCGHSSIFNDLQSNVFHSLVASLET